MADATTDGTIVRVHVGAQVARVEGIRDLTVAVLCVGRALVVADLAVATFAAAAQWMIHIARIRIRRQRPSPVAFRCSTSSFSLSDDGESEHRTCPSLSSSIASPAA